MLELCGETAEARLQKHPIVYFAGDSGYFRGFAEIGQRFEIDIALLPIGAYEPEWFMTSQHTTPEEALQAFEDVRAKLMVPMHYGTFRLADDTAREALDRLEADRTRRGIPDVITSYSIHYTKLYDCGRFCSDI